MLSSLSSLWLIWLSSIDCDKVVVVSNPRFRVVVIAMGIDKTVEAELPESMNEAVQEDPEDKMAEEVGDMLRILEDK